jgi:hypothetical protein
MVKIIAAALLIASVAANRDNTTIPVGEACSPTYGNGSEDPCDSSSWCNYDNAYATPTCQPRNDVTCFHLGGGDRCHSGMCHIDYSLGSSGRLGFQGECVEECPEGTRWDPNPKICWIDMTASNTAFQTVKRAVDISWSTGSGYASTSASVGEDITFTYTSSHDVWQFDDFAAYEACDFRRATQVAGRGDSPYTVQAAAGNSYYGCDVGSHCSSGNQKIEIVGA